MITESDLARRRKSPVDIEEKELSDGSVCKGHHAEMGGVRLQEKLYLAAMQTEANLGSGYRHTPTVTAPLELMNRLDLPDDASEEVLFSF